MGAKFIVDRRCSVKSALTLTGLIEGVRNRSVLRRVAELTAAGLLPPCEPETRLQMLLPSCGLSPGLTMRELQERSEAVAGHRIACRQCPSSLTGHVGGCIAYVPYPISEGLEYLLWQTAVRGLTSDLPEGLAEGARAFAHHAMALRATPFSTGLRTKGDLLGRRRRVYRSSRFWWGLRLSSAQVLDAFFVNGLLSGEDLQRHQRFLEAALAVAEAMLPAFTQEERRLALIEDTEPYREVLQLMELALEQQMGIYVWP